MALPIDSKSLANFSSSHSLSSLADSPFPSPRSVTRSPFSYSPPDSALGSLSGGSNWGVSWKNDLAPSPEGTITTANNSSYNATSASAVGFQYANGHLSTTNQAPSSLNAQQSRSGIAQQPLSPANELRFFHPGSNNNNNSNSNNNNADIEHYPAHFTYNNNSPDGGADRRTRD